MDNVIHDVQAAVKACMAKYADFQGRASRPEFWWFFAFQFAVYVVTGVVSDFACLLAMLALALPALAVGARRLHDTGRSGWLMLIALVPLLGGLVVLYFAAQPGQGGQNAYGNPIDPAPDVPSAQAH